MPIGIADVSVFVLKSAGALQVSEAGVHRPHVAGIHGREDDGAYSIVLSGGYEDDQVWWKFAFDQITLVINLLINDNSKF